MRFKSFACFLLMLLAVTIRTTSKVMSRQLVVNSARSFDHSHRTNETECHNPTIMEFPNDFLTLEQRRHGGIIIHALIIVYLFFAVAIVCDEYFMQSLHRICIDLKLKEDVAAATFMAAGSSAPELLTSLVGVMIAKSDVGTSAIVGTALFNVLLIPAVCALAARSVLKLDWYPLTRDSLIYMTSVVALLAVLSDGYVKWYESVFLFALYIFYIIIMYFNKSISMFLKNQVNKTQGKITSSAKLDEYSIEQESIDENADAANSKPFDPFKLPPDTLLKIKHIVLFPLYMMFFLTIPDPRRPTFRPFPRYFLSFFMSVAYLAVFTFVLVWMVVVISYTLTIPDTVAGFTVLAAGGSVPEIITGVIVTRRGKSEMAISNSLGSNVFDILMCLALPWFLDNIITSSSVTIYSKGIFYSTAVLLATVFLLILTFVLNRWRLNKILAFFLIAIWIIATVIACLIEYDIFGKFSIPFCEFH